MIEDTLTGAISEMLESGELNPSWREGDIALIYKKRDPRDIRNYRPITCLNVDYKIMENVLVRLTGSSARSTR